MNTQIYEEASDWMVKNREGDLDAQEKRRFDTWLRESPAHVSCVFGNVIDLGGRVIAGSEFECRRRGLIARARAAENVSNILTPTPLGPLPLF